MMLFNNGQSENAFNQKHFKNFEHFENLSSQFI